MRVSLSVICCLNYLQNSDKAVPWVTYTDPELAHVGMSEKEA